MSRKMVGGAFTQAIEAWTRRKTLQIIALSYFVEASRRRGDKRNARPGKGSSVSRQKAFGMSTDKSDAPIAIPASGGAVAPKVSYVNQTNSSEFGYVEHPISAISIFDLVGNLYLERVLRPALRRAGGWIS